MGACSTKDQGDDYLTNDQKAKIAAELLTDKQKAEIAAVQAAKSFSEEEKAALAKMHAALSKDDVAAAEARVKIDMIKEGKLKILNGSDYATQLLSLKNIYKKIDVNGDGDVSSEELAAIFPQAKTFFQAMDLDSDKKISEGEFLLFLDTKLDADPEKGMTFINYITRTADAHGKIEKVAAKKKDPKKAQAVADAKTKVAEDNKAAAEELAMILGGLPEGLGVYQCQCGYKYTIAGDQTQGRSKCPECGLPIGGQSAKDAKPKGA